MFILRETIVYIKHSPEWNNARMSLRMSIEMRREVIETVEDLRHEMA